MERAQSRLQSEWSVHKAYCSLSGACRLHYADCSTCTQSRLQSEWSVQSALCRLLRADCTECSLHSTLQYTKSSFSPSLFLIFIFIKKKIPQSRHPPRGFTDLVLMMPRGMPHSRGCRAACLTASKAHPAENERKVHFSIVKEGWRVKNSPCYMRGFGNQIKSMR